ncbi:MAG: N-acetylmuramoyl-L-alanine amidase [Candidatus Coatesbacteria bacterium]|nr:N-acetylmuramoyl-L-alanine amidase [Candidatus Coatesbacteria bacterium]
MKEIYRSLYIYIKDKFSIKIKEFSINDEIAISSFLSPFEFKPDVDNNEFWDKSINNLIPSGCFSEAKLLPVIAGRIRKHFSKKTVTNYEYAFGDDRRLSISLLRNMKKDWKKNYIKLLNSLEYIYFPADYRQISDYINNFADIDSKENSEMFNWQSIKIELLCRKFNLQRKMLSNINILEGKSPCYSEREDQVEKIVLHFTECDLEDTLKLFLAMNDREVSSHFVIDYDGIIYYLVPVEKRAHHAGKGGYYFLNMGIDNPPSLNSLSIGIELTGFGNFFTTAQINSLCKLTKELLKLFPDLNNPANIIGHQEAAFNKMDPGANFPWRYYLNDIFGKFSSKIISEHNGRRRLFKILKKPQISMKRKARLLNYSFI